MPRRFIYAFIAVFLVLGFADQSKAALFKLEFSGSISTVTAGPLSVGETVSGSLIYDSNALLTNLFANTSNFNGAISNFQIGGRNVDQVTFNILSLSKSFNSAVPDAVGFSVAGWQGELRESLDLELLGFDLLPGLFSIPTEFNLNELSSAGFGYTLQKLGINDGFVSERFLGSITSLTVTAVPEPSTFLLLLAGVLMLLAVHQDRQRVARARSANLLT